MISFTAITTSGTCMPLAKSTTTTAIYFDHQHHQVLSKADVVYVCISTFIKRILATAQKPYERMAV